MGASTYLRNGITDSILRNQALVVPVFCGSLHKTNPGDDGTNAVTSLVNTVEDRSQITSAASVDGLGASTGDPATWEVEEATTITHLGVSDAFTAGNWLGAVPLAQPVTVADGDVVTLASFSLEVD